MSDLRYNTPIDLENPESLARARAHGQHPQRRGANNPLYKIPKEHHSAISQSRARAIIEAHINEPFLTVDDLAKRFGIAKGTVYRILMRPESRAQIAKFNAEYAAVATPAAARRAAQLLELATARISAALTDPNCDPSFALSVYNALTRSINSPTTTNTQYNFLISREDLAASRERIRAHAAATAITLDTPNSEAPSLPAPNNNDDTNP
jgi:AraC-like DNA-binding protein